MPDSRQFKLMVPSRYTQGLRVSGKIGATPDHALLDDDILPFARSRLPRNLDELVFTIPSGRGQSNFWHCKDFLVVSDAIRRFLSSRLAGSEIEVAPVRVNRDDGSPATDDYFALKLVSVHDCIDARASLCACYPGDKATMPFSERTTACELNESVAREFATFPYRDHYVSYPAAMYSIRRVVLHLERIPHGLPLVQPAFWPRFMLIESAFDLELERQCRGGSMGYYFWTLDLFDVKASHSDLMYSLR